MIWDFRIVETRIAGHRFYNVHRVFYSDEAKTKAILVETRPATIIGNEPSVMLEDLDKMVDAFDRGTLVIPEWNRA
jgi:hypothetical protein